VKLQNWCGASPLRLINLLLFLILQGPIPVRQGPGSITVPAHLGTHMNPQQAVNSLSKSLLFILK